MKKVCLLFGALLVLLFVCGCDKNSPEKGTPVRKSYEEVGVVIVEIGEGTSNSIYNIEGIVGYGDTCVLLSEDSTGAVRVLRYEKSSSEFEDWYQGDERRIGAIGMGMNYVVLEVQNCLHYNYGLRGINNDGTIIFDVNLEENFGKLEKPETYVVEIVCSKELIAVVVSDCGVLFFDEGGTFKGCVDIEGVRDVTCIDGTWYYVVREQHGGEPCYCETHNANEDIPLFGIMDVEACTATELYRGATGESTWSLTEPCDGYVYLYDGKNVYVYADGTMKQLFAWEDKTQGVPMKNILCVTQTDEGDLHVWKKK